MGTVTNRPHDELIIQECYLPMGEMPPGYFGKDRKRDINSGWRTSDGNMHGSQWIRVITRRELLEHVPEDQQIRAAVQCDACGSVNVTTDNSGLIDTCEDCGAERA